MKRSLMLCLLLFLLAHKTVQESKTKYMSERSHILSKEINMFLGSSLTLDSDEEMVNNKLMAMKQQEFDTALATDTFLPSVHFFSAKFLMEKSKVFWFLRQMPKGAALHLHDSSMVDAWWLVKQATYRYPDKLYMCYDSNSELHFIFSNKLPAKSRTGYRPPDCTWELVDTVRQRHDPHDFDQWIYNNLTLLVDDPEKAYPSQDSIWQRFYGCFNVADGLIFYEEIFKSYFIQALSEFYVDNVQYLEFRALLQSVYDLDGNKRNESWLMSTYVNISHQFTEHYPDFFGAKVIYSASRSRSVTHINDSLATALALRREFPADLLGYDLVGQEDPGHSLKSVLDILLLPSQRGYDLPYFFHAGETDWEGRDVDENLLDAILLNSTRIGHGYAITKHPYLMQLGREKEVAIEVCPISNQVLKLVDDLRNHPAAALLATSYPVVISSDDPGIWGAQGLSYDFYEAFMGLGGAKADLRFLKQLAINSIKYSALSSTEKAKLYKSWQTKWRSFIQDMKQL